MTREKPCATSGTAAGTARSSGAHPPLPQNCFKTLGCQRFAPRTVAIAAPPRCPRRPPPAIGKGASLCCRPVCLPYDNRVTNVCTFQHTSGTIPAPLVVVCVSCASVRTRGVNRTPHAAHSTVLFRAYARIVICRVRETTHATHMSTVCLVGARIDIRRVREASHGTHTVLSCAAVVSERFYLVDMRCARFDTGGAYAAHTVPGLRRGTSDRGQKKDDPSGRLKRARARVLLSGVQKSPSGSGTARRCP